MEAGSPHCSTPRSAARSKPWFPEVRVYRASICMSGFKSAERSGRETTPAVAQFSGGHRPLESERPQVSHHPVGPCNKESQAEFGPVQMRLWACDQARNPNHHTKQCEHERHQT